MAIIKFVEILKYVIVLKLTVLFLDCFEGYSSISQHPMYMTSAMEYG